MNTLHRYTKACIMAAARRWPAELADEMARTWDAELAALRHDTSGPAPTRVWRQITFATSLALARPPERAAAAAPALWLGLTGKLARAAATLCGAIGTVVLAMLLPALVTGLWSNLDQHIPYSVYQYSAAITAFAAIALMWALGRAVGRARSTPPASPGVAVAVRIVPVAAVLVVMFTHDIGGFYSGDTHSFFGERDSALIRGVLTMTVWAAITIVALTAAIRLSRSGRRRAAWLTGIVGSLLALDVTVAIGGWSAAAAAHIDAATAPAWFPVAVLDLPSIVFGRLYPHGTTGLYGVSLITSDPTHASTLLLASISVAAQAVTLVTAFALAYAMRAARTMPAAAAERITPTAPASNPVRVVAAPIAVGALALWAWVATTTNRLPDIQHNDFATLSSPGLIIGVGLTAAALVALAFMTVTAGRGPTVALAVVIFGALFAVQCIAARHHWHGVLPAMAAFVIGLALVAGGWWLSSALAGPGTTMEATRRVLVAVGVAGALAAPTYLVTIAYGGAGPTPDGIIVDNLLPHSLNVAQYLTAALCWLVAITAALSSRSTPLRPVATVLLVIVPIVALMVFVSGDASRALYWPASTFFIQAPLAVVALGAARWQPSARRSRTVLRWLLAGVAAVALSPTIGHSLYIAAELIAHPLANAYGPSVADDGTTDVIGQLLVALAVGLAAARWAFPVETTPAIEPSPQPTDTAVLA